MTPICDANAWVTAVKIIALNILTVWFAGAMHPVNLYAVGSDLVTLCVRKFNIITDSPSTGFEERLSEAKGRLDGEKTVSNKYFCLPDGQRTLLRKAFDCIDVLKLARGIRNFGIKDVLSNVWRLDRIVSCVEPSRRKNHQTLALNPLSRVFLRTELQHIFKCSVDLTDTSDEEIEEATPQPAKASDVIQSSLISLESTLVPSHCQLYEPSKQDMKIHHAAKAITLLQSEACVMICVLHNPGHFYVIALDWKAVVQLAVQETANEVEALFRHDGCHDGGKIFYRKQTQLNSQHQITQIILVPMSHVKTDLDGKELEEHVASLALK